MTLRQAEVWLKWRPSYRGYRLRRILLATERRLGRELMTRLPERGFRVTKSAIRRHCRHLLPSKVDELKESFRQFLLGIDERIEAAVAEHIAEHVEPQLEELWQRDEVAAEAIRQLADRVNRIAGAPRKSVR